MKPKAKQTLISLRNGNVKSTSILVALSIIFLVACNNNSSSGGGSGTKTDSSQVAPKDTTTKAGASDNGGNPGAVAQVFDSKTTKPLQGASIAAQLAGKTSETAIADVNGNYAYQTLTNGTKYDFVASAKGYANQTQTVVYQGTNSLPAFGMVTQ